MTTVPRIQSYIGGTLSGAPEAGLFENRNPATGALLSQVEVRTVSRGCGSRAAKRAFLPGVRDR